MESLAIVQRDNKLIEEKVTLPALKEHQVYVEVGHAAFNPTDRLALDVNAFGDGAVLGCDFSGTVLDVHPSVSKLKNGDSIAGFVWGGEIQGLGAYSTYTIADERLCFKIPSNISSAQASSVPLAANTAWLALFSKDCLDFKPEISVEKRTVLIWGGNSTVGFFAIQLAKLYNIEVATTCSPRNFNKMREAGASYVYDYNDEDAISKLGSALPNVQHAFDTIGNETSSATVAKAMASTGGTLCTVRPGKVNTQDVPSHIKVTDVFVFTAFPTEHSYRGKAYWPVKMGDHELSAEFHSAMEMWLHDGSIRPASIRSMGGLSPSTIEEAMNLNRDGCISGEKVVFRGFP
ncbi:chaperonin 10-like protein [Fusarium tricinctum]|uniref:Chaperonin 10-like protein n=1 Tax=Fusarium tricinctum TaxID=61284 RepID=A0A8K0WBH0_9HYPO|nr:chaperonin 10-like protein [Fusarium tricinctum]